MSRLVEFSEPIFKAMERQYQSNDGKVRDLGADKLREMILRRNQLQMDYLDRWMSTQKDTERSLDGIISPVAPTAANRLGFAETSHYVGYTSVFNLLGMKPQAKLPIPDCKACD